MWAITTLFNHTQSLQRLSNYQRFKKSLPLPLITVELSYDDHFVCNDAIHVRGQSVLWHKESLLNIGIRHLPADCEKLVCLDSDILELDTAWSKDLEAALDDHCVVQPFDEVANLSHDDQVLFIQRSIVKCRAGIGELTQRGPGAPAPGFAWAFRKEFIVKHWLYNRCIVGGGDTALACALLGEFDTAMQLHRMNSNQRSSYLEWATSVHQEAGSVGFVPKRLAHLWHGAFSSRMAGERHARLQEFAYDPTTDVAGEDILHWSSDKPGLHDYVRDYFEGRNRAERLIV